MSKSNEKNQIGVFTRNSVNRHNNRLKAIQQRLNPRSTSEISVLDNLTSLEVKSLSKSKKSTKGENLKNGDATENLVNNLTNLSGTEGASLLKLEEERIYFYDLYRQIYTLIPEMAQAVEIIANNIMSPDLFGGGLYKASVPHTIPNSLTINAQVEELIKEFNISDDLHRTIVNTLILGDGFIAVVDVDQELRNIYDSFSKSKKDAPLKKPTLSLNENSQMLDDFSVPAKLDNVLESKSFNTVIDSYLTELITFDPITEHTDEADQGFLAETMNSVLEKKANKNNDGELSNVEVAKIEKKDRSNLLLKRINPSNVVKIVIQGKVIGYYVIEKTGESVVASSFVGSVQSNRTGIRSSDIEAGSSEANVADSYMALMKSSMAGAEEEKEAEKTGAHSQLVQIIMDKAKKFVLNNLKQDPAKLNDDLAKVLYHVLTNDAIVKGEKVNVSFVPAELMIHFNPGGDTYGRSTFFNSVFMAKLYLMTLMSSIMKKVARGSDQRVLYVESAIDADLEGVVEQVIKDMKHQTYAMDELGDLDSVVRTASGFKDMLIPTINGNRPIDFDIIPGEDVEVDSPFLEFLLKRMVGGTDVPLQLVTGEDVDFARTISSLNGNLVRLVSRYQNDFSTGYDKLIRILYSLKFNDVDTAEEICSEFAPPIALNLASLSANVGEAERLAGQISDLTPPPTGISEDEKTDFRESYKLNLLKTLLPNMSWDTFDKVLKGTTEDWNRAKLARKEGAEPQDNY